MIHTQGRRKKITFLADMSVKGGRGKNLIHEEFYFEFLLISPFMPYGGGGYKPNRTCPLRM